MKDLSFQNRMSALFSLFIYGLQVYQNTLSCISFYRNITKIYQFLMDYKAHLQQSIRLADEVVRSIDYGSYALFEKEVLRQKELLVHTLERLNQITPCESIYMKIGQIGLLMSVYYDLFMKEEPHHAIEYSFFLHDFSRDMRALRKAVRDKRIRKCAYGDHTQMNGMYYLPHQETKVRNDVDVRKNLIISGPNASGKTTLLKAMCLNAILSQQFGYGCYQKATLRCYDHFHSYLNIPDTSGRDSLFQAEARRCKEILDDIISGDKRHLCIFDEIYSGTNPRDAVTCATLYLRGLNRHKSRVDYLITTHYIELCESFQNTETKGSCVSVRKMNVRELPDKLEYDYKMVEGISYIHGGLHILRQLDYPASLYESV
jgi:energy-coupling factor transporter ATP-binding protein EcfA2